jgi:hypothetical protein
MVLSAVDEVVVEALHRAIVAKDLGGILRVFGGHRGGGPRLAWNPAAVDLPDKENRSLLEYWRRLGGARLPRIDEIDPIGMKPSLGTLTLLDVVDGGRDFKIRLFGSRLVDEVKRDYTGRMLSEVAAADSIRCLLIAGCRASMTEAQPLYAEVPALARVANWNRLALPLADETGRVVRLITSNVTAPWREIAASIS